MMKFESKVVVGSMCPCHVKVEAGGVDECSIPRFAEDRICIGVYGAARAFYYLMSKMDGECSSEDGVEGAVRMLPDLSFEKKDGITGDVRVERSMLCRKGRTYRGGDLWEGRADVTLRFPLLKGEESVLTLTTWREQGYLECSDHLEVKGSADDIQWFIENAATVAGGLKYVADESVLHGCRFLYRAAWDASRGLDAEAHA
jgi:hypothetical protein